ncbi:MAG: hypothetical protein J7K34_06170 [Flavobacteriaceae bacterium]|nr:hypothetical protein [Flavobacteriaceae bacterium]
MKKIKNLIVILISVITLTSCQFTERIHINENGSGVYSLEMDMSAMMGAMKQMGDSLKTNEDTKVIDTVILFKDILAEKKDSISKLSKEEQESLKAIENLKIHMVVDEKNNKMISDFIFEFNSISELANIQERISKAQSVKDGKENDAPATDTEVKYSYNGKKFTRKVIKKKLSAAEKEAYKKSMEQSASFLDGSSYKLEYTFPKAIKSTTYKGATFSDNRKTMYIQADMKTITENPKLLEFEVILK